MKPSPALEAPLRKVRARMRRVQRARGLTLAATVAIGGLLALMAVDFLLGPLPAAWRWVLTGAWLAAVLLTIRAGLAPLLRPIGLLQVARWLEQRHPEMQERLSTVLELSGSGEISPQLLESLAIAAEADAGSVDAAVEVKSARTARRWTGPAIALLAVMAIAFAVWPGETSRLLVRAVAPFSQLGNAAPGKFRIVPGNQEALIGDALKIDVSCDSATPPELWMELENGQKLTQPLIREGGHFTYTMDPIRSGFRYRARAGRAESDVFTITAWPRPELAGARATLDFPEYTGAPSQEIPLDRGIRAVTGTRVTIGAGVNTAIAAAWLTVAGKRVADGAVESAAKGGRVSLSWTLAADGSGEAAIILKHRLGAEIEAARFAVTAAPDSPPEIVLLSPLARDLKVRPDEILTMRYEATDDFGLAKIAVETEPQSLLAQPLPPRTGREMPAIYRGEAEVSVGALRSQFPGKNEFRLRIRGEDARTAEAGGPGAGVSEWLSLHIEDGAETLARQELRQQDEGARKAVEDAMRAAREARERMDWHRGEIKNPELSADGQKHLTEAAERLAEAERKLAELSKQMENGVHASKADEAKKAAEMAAQARQELENSQLQDDPAQREAKLDSARDQAAQTGRELEKLRDEMNRDRSKIEDLARVMDLAQKQKELARQAAGNLAKAEPNRDDWQNRQRQVAEEVKQQLRERPETQSGALAAQAERAKALAEGARREAADQQAMAKEISPAEIRQALAAEQAAIASQARAELAKAREARSEMADQLPAATAAADAAKEQLQSSLPEDAAAKADENSPDQTAGNAGQAGENAAEQTADPANEKAGEAPAETAAQIAKAADFAKTAAGAMKQAAGAAEPASPEAAAQAGSLAQLAERQQQVAGALESLAKGETAAAAKQLESTRAAAANDLAGEIQRMPQINDNGAMNDARNAGRQGSEHAAEAAAKSGEGKAAEAAQHHDQSAKNFQQTAQALDRAAEDFAKAAVETKGRPADAQKAPVDAAALAEAFQQSSMAATEPQPAAAAGQAENAANALAETAKSAMRGMQGKQPGQGGKPGQNPGQPGQTPGEKPEEGFRAAEADPGVPPELAKLGLSSDDWAKIQATLKSDIGAGEAGGIPEEYRGLVKSYFESMSKTKE